LPDLLEGGDLHAPHGEPARSLPASSRGQQTCRVGKLTAVRKLLNVWRSIRDDLPERHFPNEKELFKACSAEWRSANPAPDPAQWASIPDPNDRLAAALPALYEWYRSCEAMRANLLRDLAALPPAIGKNIESYPRTVTDALDAGWPHRSRLRRAAIGHAVAFETWRSLAYEGLTDIEAAQLIIGLVSTADRP
jgi:hypothetical protein